MIVLLLTRVGTWKYFGKFLNGVFVKSVDTLEMYYEKLAHFAMMVAFPLDINHFEGCNGIAKG